MEGEKFDRVVASSQGKSVQDGGQPGIEVIGLSTPVVSDEFVGLKLADGGGVEWAWTRPLGGEVGNGVEAVTWELMRFMVVCRVAWRLEQSYSIKSKLNFRVWLYR